MTFLQDIEKSTLSNGVLVVTEQIPNMKSVSLGFWVDVGSRDECEELQGCSHFIEHLLFKGTEKRTAQEISTIIESRGGDLDAFIDRDMTCYWAKVLEGDVKLAVDIISDMIQNPLFKEDDIEKERQVVLNEIREREDDPENLINDLFVETVWKGNNAAHRVYGNMDTVEKMTRDQILGYFHEYYMPVRMIVSAAGNIEHDELAEKVELHTEEGQFGRMHKRDMPIYRQGSGFIEKEFNQIQVCIGTEGSAYGGDDKAAVELLRMFLGVGASSKLFEEIREKRGLVYRVEANCDCLRDAGLFGIYAGVSKENAEQVTTIILEELEKIRLGIKPEKLKETKRKVVGKLILDSEGTEERMERLGFSTLRLGRPKEIQGEINDIESVTPEKTAEVADRIYDRNKLSVTAVGLTREEFETLEAMMT